MKPRFGVLYVLAVAVGLASPSPLRAQAKYAPGEVLVRYRPGVLGLDRAKLRSEMRGQVLRSWDNLQIERIRLEGMDVEQAIQRMKNNPLVQYIEPNYRVTAAVTPNDPLFSDLWALQNTGQTGCTPLADIRAVPAWDVVTGNQATKIGVIDTGIDLTQEDLVANLWTNPGEIPNNGQDDDDNGFPDDVHGFNFTNEYHPQLGLYDGFEGVSPTDNERVRHGTHVAGIIAARGNNATGVTGVAWAASLVAIKFLDSSGNSWASGAIEAIDYSRIIGCRLTNNSWRVYGYSQALYDIISSVCGTGKAGGQLFVAAAGNESGDNDVTPAYPASYNLPRIISVAATDCNDQLAGFSNFGATTVDLGAPGVDILSTGSQNTYHLLSGTSMAAPYVTGTLALILNVYPPILNMDAVKTRLLSTVDVLPSLQGHVVSNGRLNAFKAVTGITEGNAPAAVSNLVAGLAHTTGVAMWSAPGDDGMLGTAAAFDLRISTAPITASNFYSATQVATVAPGPSGTSHCAELPTLLPCTTYYLAIKTRDEAYNWSSMSNACSGTTTCTGSLEVTCDSYVLTPTPEVSLGTGRTGDGDRNGGGGAIEFALHGTSLNPVRAGAQIDVSISLPDSRAASLALFDVAGRRVTEREVGSLGAGRHIVQLSDARLAAGVYVLRLTRAGATLQARVVVMR